MLLCMTADPWAGAVGGAEGDLGELTAEVRSETVIVSPAPSDEVGGPGAQRAVASMMSDHLLGLVGHPDTTVVDVDLGHLQPCRMTLRDKVCTTSKA